MAEGFASKVAVKVCSKVADRRGGAAVAASVVEEMCSPSGISADQTKKEAVTAVTKDTGRGTKEKTVEWTSEALRAAQEADGEIKPIFKWKRVFQKPTEEKEEEVRRPLKEYGDELQRMEGGEYETMDEARSGGGSEEKPGGQESATNSATGEHSLGPRDDPRRST